MGGGREGWVRRGDEGGNRHKLSGYAERGRNSLVTSGRCRRAEEGDASNQHEYRTRQAPNDALRAQPGIPPSITGCMDIYLLHILLHLALPSPVLSAYCL